MAVRRHSTKKVGIGRGCTRSPAKRLAASRRYHLQMLRALTNFLRTHPDMLMSDDVAPAVEELTQLLMMAMVVRLGLTKELPLQ